MAPNTQEAQAIQTPSAVVPRKPGGFWKQALTIETLQQYVRGEINEAEATELLDVQPGDVKWYARSVRKEMGLPSLREVKKAAQVKAQLEGNA